jgi:O-antigen ligase
VLESTPGIQAGSGRPAGSLASWAARLARIAGALFFLFLPVTSFPYLPEQLGGRTLVRPLSIYPLLVLLLLVTLPRLWRRPLPRTYLPLLAFVAIAMLSSIVAFASGLDVYRGVSLAARFFRNLVTLGLGVSFYLTISLLPETWDDLRFCLRWLYAGFALALLWGTFQIPYVLHYSPTYFRIADAIQGLVSSRKLFTTRISGMTYEPKWFAEQISFLLMPWLFGSILLKRSLFRWRLPRPRRLSWVTVEWILLIWASVVLLFTFSRTGMFILAVLIFLGFWLYRLEARPRARAEQEAEAGLPSQVDPVRPGETVEGNIPLARPARTRPRRKLLLETLAILVVILGVFFVVGSQNPYFSRLWRYWTEGSKQRSRTYLEFIAFEQRFVYWTTALRTYDQQPLLGVGLGNYAFYFVDNLPDQPYDVQKEIMRQITPGVGRDRLITPKNLYARLIAETGLAGTAAFTAFLLAITGCLMYLWFSPCAEQHFWALGGVLALLVFAIVVFSFDSFALPNMWVVFGLITAAAHIPDPDQTLANP